MSDMQIPTHPKAPDYSGRPMNPYRKVAIEKYAGTSLLDVGCGNGAYVHHFASLKQTRGIDGTYFDAWKATPELFEVSDATQIRQPDNSFETVVAFELLEHIPMAENALREFRRIASKNIIITVPNCTQTPGMKASGLIFNHYSDPTHVNFWTAETLTALLTKEGYRMVHSELINRINLGPLFAEAVVRQGPPGRLLTKLFNRFMAREYPMTILMVAEVNK